MVHNQLKGLLQLHGAIMAAIIGSGIFICAALIDPAPYGAVNREVNLIPYSLVCGTALLLSIRRLSSEGSPYYSYSWIDWARITTRQIALVALMVFGLMFALKDATLSRFFVAVYLVGSWMLLFVANAMLPRVLMRLAFQREHRVPTLFVCSDRSVQRLQNWLRSREALGVHPVGFLSDSTIQLEGADAGISHLGAISDLQESIETHRIAQVVLLETPKEAAQAKYLVDECRESGCRLLVYNDLSDILGHTIVPVTQNGQQYCVLENEPLEDPVNRITKRIFDIVVSAPLVLVVLPPLVLMVWVMQSLQAPGPVLFTQERGGRKHTRFRMYKFRSMYVTERSATAEAVQARRGDSRIYPFGAFLRRTSLDEFPQFVNVLRGEMSIVGPRPHLPEHDVVFAQLTKGYRSRFNVKPGITGLAQCRGFRGEITHPTLIEQRLKHDLLYISQWSFWLDLQIFLRTALQVFSPMKSAH